MYVAVIFKCAMARVIGVPVNKVQELGPHSVLLKLSQVSHSVSAEQNKVQCGAHGGVQRAESREQ